MVIHFYGQIIKRSEELHKLIHEQVRKSFMVIHFSYTPVGEHFCYLNRKTSKIQFVPRICHSKHLNIRI